MVNERPDFGERARQRARETLQTAQQASSDRIAAVKRQQSGQDDEWTITVKRLSNRVQRLERSLTQTLDIFSSTNTTNETDLIETPFSARGMGITNVRLRPASASTLASLFTGPFRGMMETHADANHPARQLNIAAGAICSYLDYKLVSETTIYCDGEGAVTFASSAGDQYVYAQVAVNGSDGKFPVSTPTFGTSLTWPAQSASDAIFVLGIATLAAHTGGLYKIVRWQQRYQGDMYVTPWAKCNLIPPNYYAWQCAFHIEYALNSCPTS